LREFFLFKWFQVYQDGNQNLSAAERVQGILREILGNQSYPLSNVDAARLNWVIMVVGSERFRKEAGFSASFSLGARADKEGLDAETTAWLVDTYSRAKLSGKTITEDKAGELALAKSRTEPVLRLETQGLAETPTPNGQRSVPTSDSLKVSDPEPMQPVKNLRQTSSAAAVLQSPRPERSSVLVSNLQEIPEIDGTKQFQKVPPPPPDSPPPPPPLVLRQSSNSTVSNQARERASTSMDSTTKQSPRSIRSNSVCVKGSPRTILYNKDIIHEEIREDEVEDENKKQSNDLLVGDIMSTNKIVSVDNPENEEFLLRMPERLNSFKRPRRKSKRYSVISSPADLARVVWTFVPSVSSGSSYYSRDEVSGDHATDGQRLGFYRHVTGEKCGLLDKDIRNLSRYIMYSNDNRRDSFRIQRKTVGGEVETLGTSFHPSETYEGDSWLSPDWYNPTEDDISRLNGQIDSWEFDIFELNELSSGRPLSLAFCSILRKNDLYSVLNLNEVDVVRFIVNIENGYNPENPYHNRIHAADVLQTVHHFFTHNFLRDLVTSVDVLCSYVSAAIHDYRHPGIKNDFLVATRNELALQYNDRSVLENMHVYAAFKVMNDPQKKCNILSCLGERYGEARETIIQMVLGTDMSHHAECLGVFKNEVLPAVAALTVRRKTQSSQTSGPAPKLLRVKSSPMNLNLADTAQNDLSAEGSHDARCLKIDMRRHVLRMTLHCADLSNPAKPQALSFKWAQLVQEEFFRQGDMEKQLGLPISMFGDRDKAALSKCQAGFSRIIVKPLFETYCQFLPSLNPVLEHCDRNIEFWEHNKKVEEETGMPASPTSANFSREPQPTLDTPQYLPNTLRRFSFLQTPKSSKKEFVPSHQGYGREKNSSGKSMKKGMKSFRSLYIARENGTLNSSQQGQEFSQNDIFSRSGGNYF